MGFHRSRVTEVYAHSPTGSGRVGSGYRLTATTVLTAAHVAPGPPAADQGAVRCEVRPLDEREWISGSVLWHDEAADVALIGLPPDAPALPPGSPLPQWGEVAGDEAVSCMAVGFPWAQVRRDRTRDTEQLKGFVMPASLAKAGQLALNLQSALPARPAQGSPWAGMSGAAVFAGPYLIGVVIVDQRRFEGQLIVAPVAPLVRAREEFAALAEADPATLLAVEPVFRLAVTRNLSVLLGPYYQSLPQGLTFARVPVRLLLPEYGTVPFVGREQTLKELRDWCLTQDRFGLRVVTGDGGAGKTRLAAELAARMAEEGWDAGVADADAPAGATRLAPDRSMLLIVDDADVKVELVSGLVSTLGKQPGLPPSRLLLLARHTHGWWRQLNANTSFLAENFAAADISLHSGQLSPDEQRRHHQAACASFAANLGRPAPEPAAFPPVTSSPEDFANPLLVHMHALLAVLRDAPVTAAGSGSARPSHTSRESVLEHVLTLESRRWALLVEEIRERATFQAITVASLVAASSHQELRSVLTAVRDLKDAALRSRVAELLRDIYPGDGWVAPLRPDLLTEQLLAQTPELAELVVRTAERISTAEEFARLLSELSRAAANRPVVRDALDALLTSRLRALFELAKADVTSPLPTALGLAVRQAPQPQVAAELVTQLDSPSTGLAVLAAEITSQAVTAQPAQGGKRPDVIRLAGLLGKQSDRLATVGDREKALDAVNESVALYRRLARERPEDFQADLAGALNGRAMRLADLGRHEEALAAIEEAIGIYLSLAVKHPRKFRPVLARLRITQSHRLADLGRQEKALEAVNEAVTLYRLLVARSGLFQTDLAGALNSQSMWLADLGHHKRALAAINEALDIYRPLAAEQPDAFQVTLAQILHTQAYRLADVGDHEQALAAIGEVLGIYGPLAAKQPGAFRAHLAGALKSQSDWLAGRQPEEALAAIDEAVSIYRPLADEQPGAFRARLAGALNSQSDRMAGLAQRAKALDAIDAAVTLYRQLEDAHPGALQPELAASLNSQSMRRAELGRPDQALAPVNEAIGIYQRLVDARPDAIKPHLAGALHTRSARLAELGRRDEALTAIGDALSVYRSLVGTRPDAFRSELAGALHTQSDQLAELGRSEEALAAIDEALSVYRSLAAEHPGAFPAERARSLSAQSARLAALGRRQEALAAIGEAVGIYRPLASDHPAAFRADLAISLNSQSARLAELGAGEQALEAIDETLARYRSLASEQPDAFGPPVADTLLTRSYRLADLGRQGDALVAADAAADLYRSLERSRPGAFRSELAGTLRARSDRLTALGQHLEALAAIDETLALYRSLASEQPDAFRPRVADTLHTRSYRLADAGRRDDALAAADQAADLYRALERSRPGAFRSELAGTLRTRSDRLTALGRPEEALAAIDEATALYQPPG